MSGLTVYCPACKRLNPCVAVPMHKAGQAKARRPYMTGHANVQFFRRARTCGSCGNLFLTAELEERFVAELVELRKLSAVNNTKRIRRWRRALPEATRAQVIPRELAKGMVKHCVWWLTHSSYLPALSPGFARKIYKGRRGWSLDFGANTFLPGVAIERCYEAIYAALTTMESGTVVPLRSVLQSMENRIAGAVANYDGVEYGGSYPLTGKELIFGAHSVDVGLAPKYLADLIKLYEIFV